MAKQKESVSKETKGKMTFVMFQLDGSDETLQQGFKTIEQAFEKLGPQPKLIVQPVGLKPTQSSEQMELTDVLDAVAEQNDVDEEAGAVGEKSNKRKYPTPKILNDLDLEKEVSLKDYFAQRGSPSKTTKRYLVIGAWLKDQRGVNEITNDHLFTCLRALNIKPQADILQPVRQMKIQGWFEEVPEKTGTYSLTSVGLSTARDVGSDVQQ